MYYETKQLYGAFLRIYSFAYQNYSGYMNRSHLLSLLFAGALVCPAATITLTGTDSSRGMNLNYGVNGNNSVSYAGAIRITITGVPAGTVNGLAFCVDLFTSIGLGSYATTLQEPSTVPNGERVAWLLQNVLGDVDTAREGAGLQLAIWDIVHDNGDGLTAGAVRRHSAPNSNDQAAYGFAATYLALSAGQSSTAGTVYRNVSFQGVPAQTLMGADTVVPNPEPGTWVMLGLGAGLIGLAQVRIRRAG